MTLEETQSGWTVFLRFGKGRRKRFSMPRMLSDKAKERYAKLRALAADLGAVEHIDAEAILRAVAGQESDQAFAGALRAGRDALRAPEPEPQGPRTFQDVANLWTSGELHAQYPKRVRKKKDLSARHDAYRLRLINAVVGDVPLKDFTVEHAEQALATLPAMSDKTYGQYQLVIHQVLRFAVLPLKLIERSPLPEGWIIGKGKTPAFSFLYPEEEALLLRSDLVPYEERLLYGVLGREGLRVSEALRLTWADLDLSRGVLSLDVNKTASPRAWQMRADVTEELTFWKAHTRGKPTDRVFPTFDYDGGAQRFRDRLWEAGVRRRELHESTAERRRIRIHDLRGTFVTLELANGRSETWVMDRTGHRSSNQLHGYRRQARSIEHLEAQRRTLAPLQQTLSRPPPAPVVGSPGPSRSLWGVVAGVVGNAPKPWEMAPAHGSVVSAPESVSATPEPDLALSASVGEGTPPADAAATPRVVGSDQGVVGADVSSREDIHRLQAETLAALVRIEESLAEDLKALIAAGRYELADKVMAELRERRLQRTAPQVTSLEAARKKRDQEGGK